MSVFVHFYGYYCNSTIGDRLKELRGQTTLFVKNALTKAIIIEEFDFLQEPVDVIMNYSIKEFCDVLKWHASCVLYSTKTLETVYRSFGILALGISLIINTKSLEKRYKEDLDIVEQCALCCLPHSSRMIIDATVAPSNIRYPTDLGLVNHGREFLEKMIHTIWIEYDFEKMPDAAEELLGFRDELPYDPKIARNIYLSIAKQRRWTKQKVTPKLGALLEYLEQAIMRFDILVAALPHGFIRKSNLDRVPVIKELYRQQKYMYDEQTGKCEKRIVSLWQDFVRPIYRGKRPLPTEFGIKLHIMDVDGKVYLLRSSWEAFNEGSDLVDSIVKYNMLFMALPTAILADQIYKSSSNIVFCKCLGIRFSGRRLKQSEADAKKEAENDEFVVQDACTRAIIEGRIGTLKTSYGLELLMCTRQSTQETSVSVSFTAMNVHNDMLRIRRTGKAAAKRTIEELIQSERKSPSE